ncbi:Potassium transporter [Neofusicoccum parvum]|uniref:Potassium transporter n=1 Tax=Neofusicoccum parvum TaxID=310453 RepID=A0ACB5SDV9_9PEZI|nr:Potassium transporter [Neofusicoccum parvum]
MAEYRHYAIPDEQWEDFPNNLPPDTRVEGMNREHHLIKPQDDLEISEFNVSARDGHPVLIRSYRPSDKKADELIPLVIYLHGGGFVTGGLETDDRSCRAVALRCGVVVLNVEYRLAPENKFPIGWQDSYDVAASPAAQKQLSVDPTKGFILGGTSAGANFTAGLSHFFAGHDDPTESSEKLSPPLTGLMFIAPSVCHPSARPEQYADRILSVDEITDAPGLTRKSIDYFAAKYGAPPSDRRLSPLRFPSHVGLAKKAIFQVCGWDPRRDEGLLFEQLLKEAGVQTRLLVYSGLPHGFWTTCPDLPVSEAWEEDLVEAEVGRGGARLLPWTNSPWGKCRTLQGSCVIESLNSACPPTGRVDAYILLLGILGLIVIYPYGNVPAVDAYFFGVSATTESGLNTIDVKALKTYQQLAIYFLPTVTNLGFINIIVVIVRLFWFEKRLKELAPTLLRPVPADSTSTAVDKDVEAQIQRSSGRPIRGKIADGENAPSGGQPRNENQDQEQQTTTDDDKRVESAADTQKTGPTQIVFAEGTRPPRNEKALRVPSPRERERGRPLEEVTDVMSDEDDDKITRVTTSDSNGLTRRRTRGGPSSIANATSIERVASSMFVLGGDPSAHRSQSRRSGSMSRSSATRMPYLSRQATIGRNSQFYNLSTEDREQLGGIEYRSLKLLLKIVTAYFFGLHIFGAICLAGWIQTADSKYRDYLAECGQDKTWWGFYSAQTMVNNLGFTLTPDSMITFQDATFPMLVMTFLAYAGNTLYPCLLRFAIWMMAKLVPRNSSMQEPLSFLLDHPRRCYTLLFPSRATWILFGILFVMNFVDTLLILVLDLHNSAVNNLPGGPRVLAALFQAASSRHTGTATFNLADVHPAVQFSLLVMMYISVFPIAIAVRSSNTYEERSLGVYSPDPELDDTVSASSYLRSHLQNQLSFDLWYLFLGVFCICIAEADRIMDEADPAFQVFPIFFEVVSAYGNVGLSLGYPTVLTSLSGQFTTFSKLVICAMMIRGRHRGLPYTLDRAIQLPNDVLNEQDGKSVSAAWSEVEKLDEKANLKRAHTS